MEIFSPFCEAPAVSHALPRMTSRIHLGEAIHKVSIQSFKTDDQNKRQYNLINSLELGKYVQQYHVPLNASK